VSASFADILSPFPAKRLARAAETHPKTAQRWREGATAPGGDALLRLMRDDDIFAAILRAAGRADEAAKQRAIAILTGDAA
jgi:hypothetical protein